MNRWWLPMTGEVEGCWQQSGVNPKRVAGSGQGLGGRVGRPGARTGGQGGRTESSVRSDTSRGVRVVSTGDGEAESGRFSGGRFAGADAGVQVLVAQGGVPSVRFGLRASLTAARVGDRSVGRGGESTEDLVGGRIGVRSVQSGLGHSLAGDAGETEFRHGLEGTGAISGEVSGGVVGRVGGGGGR